VMANINLDVKWWNMDECCVSLLPWFEISD